MDIAPLPVVRRAVAWSTLVLAVVAGWPAWAQTSPPVPASPLLPAPPPPSELAPPPPVLAPPPDSAPAPPPAAAAGETVAPSATTMELYGYTMLDMGYDFGRMDPDWTDVMRPTKLPSAPDEFGKNGQTFAGVRQTRFGVKT